MRAALGEFGWTRMWKTGLTLMAAPRAGLNRLRSRGMACRRQRQWNRNYSFAALEGESQSGRTIGTEPEELDAMRRPVFSDQTGANALGVVERSVNLEQLAIPEIMKRGGTDRIGAFRQHGGLQRRAKPEPQGGLFFLAHSFRKGTASRMPQFAPEYLTNCRKKTCWGPELSGVQSGPVCTTPDANLRREMALPEGE